MKLTTLEELKEKTHGPIGTPKRDALENFLDKNVRKRKKRKKRDKKEPPF